MCFLHRRVLQDVFFWVKGGSSIKGISEASLLLHIHFIVAPDISLFYYYLLFTLLGAISYRWLLG
jgi:hypothetical protein